MSVNPNIFPFSQHTHAGATPECVIAESSIQELLVLGEELLVELVGLYIDDASERVQVIVDFFAAGDMDGIGRTAHALKSSSASLGALLFSDTCNELEQLGDAGTMEAVGPRVKRLESMFVEVREALLALRAFYEV